MGSFPRLLTHVEGDEVSLVKRAANRRRFLLAKEDGMPEIDAQLADMLDVPAPGEGAFLDEVRKDGVDDTVERALVASLRLVNGIRSELSPETVEKLGTELYPRTNKPLNTDSGANLNDDGLGTGDGGDELNEGAEPDNDYDDGLSKAEFSADERKRLASQGQAQSDGSYPIRNKGDLDNAVTAFGRSKNKGKTKAWIISRAKALGATSALPDSWNVSKSTEEEGGTVETHAGPVQKEDGTWDLTGVPDETRPFFEAMLEKADETAAELESTKEKLAKAHEQTGELSEKLRLKEFIEKADREYGKVGSTDEIAEILKAASEHFDEETFGKLETLLKAANAKIESGDLFAELGRTALGESAPDSAYAEAVKKADEMVEKSGDLSREQAMGKVWEQNPDLYARYMSETGRAVA